MTSMVQSYRKTMCVTKNERALDWLAAQVGIDEDIDMLDTLIPWPFPSYKSSPIQSSRSSRIQPTPLHGFGDISLIRRPNEVILDVLES